MKEYLRLHPDRAQLIEEFSRMTPPRIIPLKGPDKLLGLIDSSIQKQEDSVRQNLEQQMNKAQNPSVNLELNPPNTDQQQKEGPVIVERTDKGEKI